MIAARAISSNRQPVPFDVVVLTHEERHLRRRVITLQHGDEVLVDLAKPLVLQQGDRLLLEDGRHVEVIAADEELMSVRAGPRASLAELAWHIGNRHLPAQIEQDRILLERDHVIRDMLRCLGAWVESVREPFEPARGAYARQEHAASPESDVR